MITLIRNGQIRTMNQGTFDMLKGNLDGWIVMTGTVDSIEKKTPLVQTEQPQADITREHMVEYLKEKGIKVHPMIGDDKLKHRYNAELENH
jgi:hypothetical protein